MLYCNRNHYELFFYIPQLREEGRMFAKRSDGKAVKVDPYTKLPPHIMSKRSDALNFAKVSLRCEGIDEFVKKERARTGSFYSYLDIVIAAAVRLFAERKALNRFVNAGRIYQRDHIYVSFVIKRSLKDTAFSTAVKVEFNGSETIEEVKNKIEGVIEETSGKNDANRVDTTAAFMAKAPNFVIRLMWWTLKKLDKWNMLPKSLIKTSPFHTSLFITNMKSIKTDYIYHHCYDFGTTGIFFGMGKEQMVPVVEGNTVVPGKVMTIGVVTDERFCDGLYFANSLREMKRFFDNLDLLLEPYHDEQVDAVIAADKAAAENKAKKAGKK